MEINWQAAANHLQEKKITEFLRVHQARVTGFLSDPLGMGTLRIFYEIGRAPAAEVTTRTTTEPEWAEVTYGPNGGLRHMRSSWDERRKARQKAQIVVASGGRTPRPVTQGSRNFLK